jgi:hypothetical protein
MNIIQWISFLWTTKGKIKDIQEAKVKSGIFSTEFWLVVVSAISTVGLFFLGSIDPKTLVIVMTALTTVYTISRTIIKATASKSDDIAFNKFLNALKPLLDKIGVKVEPLDETVTP